MRSKVEKLKEINNCIQWVCIELIKSNSKDFQKKNVLLLLIKESWNKMTSKYCEKDKRADPYTFESLSRYFDVIYYHSAQCRFKSNTPKNSANRKMYSNRKRLI